MYRFFIILSFSVLAYTSNAQTYVPFPTSADTAVWFVKSSYWVAGAGQTGYHNIISYGDTIFDGLEYTKIYRSHDGSFPGDYYAAIRESNKVVYLRDWVNSNLSTDTVFFDFNAEVGDTMNWFSVYGSPLAVHSIDSVQVADGTYRKRFHLGSSFYDLMIIEGIGSNYDFIPVPMVGGGGTTTYCHFLNGSYIWSPNGITESDCYTSTKQLKSNSTIKIHPNPTSDILNIEFENTAQRELMIFNQIGQMVLNEISNEINVVLNLEQLPKGFYVLAIQSEDGVLTKKIVRN